MCFRAYNKAVIRYNEKNEIELNHERSDIESCDEKCFEKTNATAINNFNLKIIMKILEKTELKSEESHGYVVKKLQKEDWSSKF